MPIHTARFTPAPAGTMLTLFVRTCPTKVHPVSVGNMKRLPELLAGTTVHPRIRGEYDWSTMKIFCVPGSPLHPRGISTNSACATSTTLVHPRIRGEYFGVEITGRMPVGSPPHPRGISLKPVIFMMIGRFTPASAGNIQVILLLAEMG